MSISVKTGLPVLPKEGMFWRVEECVSQESRFFFTGSKPSAYISIMERFELHKVTPKIFHLPFGIQFEFGQNETFEMKESQHVRIPIKNTRMIDITVYNDDDTELGVKEVEESYSVQADDLTSELLLEHAHKALERYKEITKSRGYLGDYPPKSIFMED